MAMKLVGFAQSGGNGVTSLTLIKPTVVANGDLMLAVLSSNVANSPTLESLTLLDTHSYSTSYQQRLYYKVANNESGDYYFQGLTSGKHLITMLVFRGGFNTSDPFDVYSNTEYVTSDATIEAASVTVAAVGSPLIVVGSSYSTSAITHTRPTSGNVGDVWVEGVDYGSTTPDLWHPWYFVPRWESSGATGVIDITRSASTTTSKHAFLIALNPVALDEDISIERKAGSGGTYVEEVDTDYSAGTWADTDTFTDGVTYYYQARRQLDQAGYSTYSTAATVAYASDTTKTEAGSVAFALTATGAIGVTEYTATEAGSASLAITATGAIGVTEYVATEAGASSFALTANGAIGVTEYVASEAGATQFAITGVGAVSVTEFVAEEAGGVAFAITATGSISTAVELPEAGDAAFAISATGAIGLTEYVATEAGAAAFALTATADAKAVLVEAGAAAYAITAVGAIDIAGTKTEAGATSFTVTAMGDEKVQSAEAGSATFAITATGSIDAAGQKSEAGAADFTITATGAIGITEYVASEAGSAQFAITGAADAIVLRSEAGAASLAITAAGDITLVEFVATESGVAAFVITAAGDLSVEHAVWDEAGTAEFEITGVGAVTVATESDESGTTSFTVTATGAVDTGMLLRRQQRLAGAYTRSNLSGTYTRSRLQGAYDPDNLDGKAG